MSEKFQEKIIEYIDALSVKLGVAAEHVYEVLVRQKIVEGMVYSIVTLGVLIASIVAFKKSLQSFFKCYEQDEDKVFGLGIVSVVFGLVLAISLIVTIASLPDQILKIYNPEYYAIKTILDAIGGK